MESIKTYSHIECCWKWTNSQDQYHREDGPAREYDNGDKYWYRNGELHREDGPAMEFVDGTKSWYRNGQLHREDGPAIEYYNGHKEYWINGIRVQSEEELQRAEQKRKEIEIARLENESFLI